MVKMDDVNLFLPKKYFFKDSGWRNIEKCSYLLGKRFILLKELS